MLRRPAGKGLGSLRFPSLAYRRPSLTYPCTALPRYQSDWKSDKLEPFDRQNSQPRDKRWRRIADDDAKVTLDVDSLGKPGEIFVVSGPRRPHRRNGRALNLRPQPEIQSHDTISSILDGLDGESSPPSDTLINESINAIRGKYPVKETLPTSEFRGMLSKLKSSFSTKQLLDYISKHKRDSGALEESPWTWVSTPKNKQSKRVERSPQGKPRLAEAIVRHCWQMAIEGEVGRLDFPLSVQSMALLVHAKHFSFHELSNLHGCGIDLTRSAGLVSVTGKQKDCEAVVEIILDAAARAREEDVGIKTHINDDGNQIFTPDFLEWVNTTYGVLVEHQPNGPPAKILYLAENKLGADNARRTLNLALSNTTSSSTPFSTYLPASELATVYSYKPEAHASWFERQKSWFRWAMSSNQNEEAESLDTPFFDKHHTRLSDELLKLLQSFPASKVSPANHLHESVTATFGKSLFMQKSSFDDASTMSPAQLGKLSLPRVFTKDGPPVTQLMNALWPDLPRKDAETYRLRLIPTFNAHNLPELEIEVAMESQLDGEVAIESVKAIQSTNSVDYLLPENSLDLRFTRTISQELWKEPLPEAQDVEYAPRKARVAPDVEEMLQSIKRPLQGLFSETLSSSKNAPLPTFCQISLPVEFAQQFGLQGDPKNASGTSPEQNVSVEYMFLPLSDIRGAIVQKYDFDGRPLHYQHYDSGPFLASRANEVSLLMPLSSSTSTVAEADDSQQALDQQFHEFYNTACDIAFKVHASRYAE
ncbi:unnamed protein product [Penicillium olsonii]|uniref:Respiratory complex assembly protein Rmp1 n=1 Tax=Penicillium olsonii TaxID=99116 RepID=A0A9W4HYE3_PENOL|nr:unnamed protein product [Penicillium olsonii]CAG8179665.1 unnamed protein product [Penicillium olsonii]